MKSRQVDVLIRGEKRNERNFYAVNIGQEHLSELARWETGTGLVLPKRKLHTMLKMNSSIITLLTVPLNLPQTSFTAEQTCVQSQGVSGLDSDWSRIYFPPQ